MKHSGPRWTWMTLERLALFRSQLRWKCKILSHWAVLPGCRGMIRMVSMTNEARLLECWTSCGRGDCVERGGRTGDGAKIRPNLHFWRWPCFNSVQILWAISIRILEMKWGTSTWLTEDISGKEKDRAYKPSSSCLKDCTEAHLALKSIKDEKNLEE